MTPIVLGNKLLSNDAKARLTEPASIGRCIVVAPEHGGVGAEPSSLPPFVPRVTQGDEEPSAGRQPAGHAPEEPRVILARDVDEGVERDHGGEGAGREIDLGEVRTEEPGRRNEATGPSDLAVGDVHSRDAERA